MRVLRTALLSVMVWSLAAVPADAAGDGERVGENIGDLLGGWSKSLFMGIAGLVALIFLLNRRFADLAIFMVAVVIVGGFVLAPDAVSATVRDLWRTLTA